jgi:hypothetical protein
MQTEKAKSSHFDRTRGDKNLSHIRKKMRLVEK